MADYRLTETDIVFRVFDNAWIPNDPANSDRTEYDNWLALGNVPDPYVAPPPPPPMRDANARIDAGILASLTVVVEVRNAIHAIPTGFNAAHFSQMMVQLNVLTDVLVAMLQAQADT